MMCAEPVSVNLCMAPAAVYRGAMQSSAEEDDAQAQLEALMLGGSSDFDTYQKPKATESKAQASFPSKGAKPTFN